MCDEDFERLLFAVGIQNLHAARDAPFSTTQTHNATTPKPQKTHGRKHWYF
jgi:hypothetical protein